MLFARGQGLAAKLRALCQIGFAPEARAELAAFDAKRLRDIPRSREYLAVLGHMAFACVETGSKPHASVVYELLAPYPQLCIATISLHSYGPTSRTLGQLAGLLAEHGTAAAHFERSLVDAERFGLKPQLALTRYQYAQLLAETGKPSDIERARSLVDGAQSLAESMGMQPLTAQSQQLRAALG